MTVAELQEKIAAKDSEIKSVQFNFTQEMKSGLSKEVQKAAGTAYFKKPKNLRIDQASPEKQTVVTAGKSVFIYTPRFNQALKDSWSAWAAKNSFFPGLFGVSDTFKKLKKDYAWEVVGSENLNGEKTLSVSLKGRDGILKFWLGESDFVPRKTEITSGTLQVTTTLVSLELNPSLNDKLFQFSPPPGTNIIKVP